MRRYYFLGVALIFVTLISQRPFAVSRASFTVAALVFGGVVALIGVLAVMRRRREAKRFDDV